jgi:hypothetical protein
MKNTQIDDEFLLVDEMAALSSDPLKWVYYAFPWGEAGALEAFDGPDEWQADILAAIRDGLMDAGEAVRVAVASGHGIGKSALVVWLILWSLSTFADTRGVVTANTGTQLKTKTWAEMAKWFPLLICKHWFVLESTSIHSADVEHERTWRFDVIPWSKQNSEAFAGLHNQGKRIMIVFDEASAIDDIIWEVSEGALTDKDTEMIWVAFGNPTRNTGRFADCFGRYRTKWIHRNVDSRLAKMTNKKQLQEWVDLYGEDSDFVKVRVRGVFPSASAMQLIPMDMVERGFERGREIDEFQYDFAARILGVDVARYGDDRSAIFLRQGLRAELLWQGMKVSTMELAALVASFEDQYKTTSTFIDAGYGVGVIDKLRELGRGPLEIAFNSRPIDERFGNKRAEMWWGVKEWLALGGALPEMDIERRKEIGGDLRDDLIGPEYFFTPAGKIMLERKEDMKKRGMASPDLGDALALTFAAPVKARAAGSRRAAGVTNYD